MNNKETHPESPTVIQFKSNHKPYTHDPDIPSLRLDQVARMFQIDLHLETIDDLLVCPNEHGEWVRASKREDGTPVIYELPPLKSKRADALFLELMVELLIEEKHWGLHTEKSLDEDMDICERLVPSRKGWVDSYSLHFFLEEELEFPWWCRSIAHFVAGRPHAGYRHTSITRAFKIECDREIVQAAHPFRVNTNLAFRIALSSRTRRGDNLREKVLSLSTMDRFHIFVGSGNLMSV